MGAALVGGSGGSTRGGSRRRHLVGAAVVGGGIAAGGHVLNLRQSTCHCVTTAYSIQYSNMLYRFVAQEQ